MEGLTWDPADHRLLGRRPPGSAEVTNRSHPLGFRFRLPLSGLRAFVFVTSNGIAREPCGAVVGQREQAGASYCGLGLSSEGAGAGEQPSLRMTPRKGSVPMGT